MYMAIKITKPEEKQGTTAPTKAVLTSRKAELEQAKINLGSEILTEMLNPIYNADKLKLLRGYYHAAHYELVEIDNKIADLVAEQELMETYLRLLEEDKHAKYAWMAACMSGDLVREKNINADIVGISHAIMETRNKLGEIHDRKFAKGE